MSHPQKNKYSIFTRLVNLVLPLSPILQTYGWGRYDFTFIITIFLSIIWIIFYNGAKYIRPKWFSIYLFYYLFVQIISATSVSSLIPLGWLRIFLVYGLFFSEIKYSLFIKYYSKITIICLGFWLIQYFSFLVFGIKIPGIFTFLPIALDISDLSVFLENLYGVESRSSSFFSEPALFAQYLFPILIVLLFKNQWRNNWLYICIIIFCLLLLKSGNALIGLSIVLAGFFYWKFRNANNLKKVTLIIFIPIAIIVGGYYYFNSEIGQSTLERQDQLNSNLSSVRSGQSGFIRIYRGYYVYEDLPFYRQIIGANNSDLIKEAIKESSVSNMFIDGDFYFNTFQTVLIRTGMIGLIIISIFFGKLYIRATPVGKTSLFTLFILGFISSMYFTELMFIYISLAFYNRKKISR